MTATLPASVDPGKEAVIQGRIISAGAPVATAYARLLDSSGEFVAEVPASEDGVFRFFATTGSWTVRVLAPGGVRVDTRVEAQVGKITETTVVI